MLIVKFFEYRWNWIKFIIPVRKTAIPSGAELNERWRELKVQLGLKCLETF